jgi:TolB-like protein
MYRFAGNELDVRTQELRRRGDAVHVEPQVFNLLTFLIQNRDRIVTKDEILDAVWQGRIVSEAALSSRINAARKAVGDTGDEQSLIRTFHKRGFRFVGDVETLEDEGSTRLESPPAGSATPQARLDRRPSVAVVPFANLSENPEHEYFSYGLTEDLIRMLGRNRWLRVLSRHSALPHGEDGASAAAIGKALSVRYVVEGSVRRIGGRVRITVGLVDAHEGTQLWSEVYDLDLPDIFEIQDAMAQQLAAIIEPELALAERTAAARKATGSLDAWDCYQRGFWHLWGFTAPGFVEAEAYFRRAIAEDPDFARAHAALSYVHLQKAFYDPSDHRQALLESALELGRTAVALDDRDSLCHCVLGRALCMLQRYKEAVSQLERAVELNPSFAQGYFALAFALIWLHREEDAIALLERAADLSPRDPHLWTFQHVRALAHLSLDELSSAEHFARRSILEPTATHWPYATLAAILGLAGGAGVEQARAGLLRRKPDYTCRFARNDLFFCSDGKFVRKYIEGLRRAGIPH